MSFQKISVCANDPFGWPLAVSSAERADPDFDSATRASLADLRWDTGLTLRVGFVSPLNGDHAKLLRQKVQEFAPIWSQYANIKFQFDEGTAEHITINFSPDVAPAGTYSSQIGTASAEFSKGGKPSMHLVFNEFDRTIDDIEYRRVILHEFGHALGLIHEHARPDAHLIWDEEALRTYYVEKTSGSWDWDMIQEQVVNRYQGRILNSTRFDPKSIMMYPFPAGLATFDDEKHTPFESEWNRDLSDQDREFIAACYPA